MKFTSLKKKTDKSAKSQARRSKLILVPIDFSDSSLRALRHAVGLATGSGGSLTIVHVGPADYGLLGIGREEFRELEKSLQRQPANRLHAFARADIPGNVQANLEVRCPAEEIVAAATESKSDLIVLSTHGLTGLDRYLVGSVADRVARLARCPGFLMRPGKRLPARRQIRPAGLRFKHKTKSG